MKSVNEWTQDEVVDYAAKRLALELDGVVIDLGDQSI